MLAQIAIKEEQTFGPQLEKDRVDKLYHIIASHSGKQCP